MAEAQLQIEHYWAGALRRAVIEGDVETGSVMAGQSVGMVTREEPVAEIIKELADEAAAALECAASLTHPHAIGYRPCWIGRCSEAGGERSSASCLRQFDQVSSIAASSFASSETLATLGKQAGKLVTARMMVRR